MIESSSTHWYILSTKALSIQNLELSSARQPSRPDFCFIRLQYESAVLLFAHLTEATEFVELLSQKYTDLESTSKLEMPLLDQQEKYLLYSQQL